MHLVSKGTHDKTICTCKNSMKNIRVSVCTDRGPVISVRMTPMILGWNRKLPIHKPPIIHSYIMFSIAPADSELELDSWLYKSEPIHLTRMAITKD